MLLHCSMHHLLFVHHKRLFLMGLNNILQKLLQLNLCFLNNYYNYTRYYTGFCHMLHNQIDFSYLNIYSMFPIHFHEFQQLQQKFHLHYIVFLYSKNTLHCFQIFYFYLENFRESTCLNCSNVNPLGSFNFMLNDNFESNALLSKVPSVPWFCCNNEFGFK